MSTKGMIDTIKAMFNIGGPLKEVECAIDRKIVSIVRTTDAPTARVLIFLDNGMHIEVYGNTNGGCDFSNWLGTHVHEDVEFNKCVHR